MKLVAATPAHAVVMAAIHARAFPPSEAWGPDAFALQTAQPGAFGLIADLGGVVLARVAADEAEILTLAVDPVARRQGIGHALLRAAMTQAVGAGARSMVLEVAADNGAARALYAEAGFAEAGRRRRYYASGSDALILRACLPCANTAA